jgi:hypothetical protein
MTKILLRKISKKFSKFRKDSKILTGFYGAGPMGEKFEDAPKFPIE